MKTSEKILQCSVFTTSCDLTLSLEKERDSDRLFVNNVNGVLFDVSTISNTSVIGKPELLLTSDVESDPLYPHHGLVMTASARWGRHHPGHSPHRI